MEEASDTLSEADVSLRAHHLMGLVCTRGGVACPNLRATDAESVLERLRRSPALRVRLTSTAETIPHYRRMSGVSRCSPEDALARKRDLDVLQRLGLVPGAIRRARYLIELLFERIASPVGLCSQDTPGWEGCPFAADGAYERIYSVGWPAIVGDRSADDMRAARLRNKQDIDTASTLFVRPHHFMCLACGYAGGEHDSPRTNDTLYEILCRIRREPDVPVTLVEGPCMACDCCDGFDEPSGRCVHSCGLIRDYKKDLDVLQRLGLMPGDTLPARTFLERLFACIHSTREICGYGDGVVRSNEWLICGGPDGNPGYAKTRESGLWSKGQHA